MCRYKSGVAVKSGGDVRVYTLKGEDSHTKIRAQNNIRDGIGAASEYQTPIELVPVRGLRKAEDFDFVFDDIKPEWWTNKMTASATKQLFGVATADWDGDVLRVGGDLSLDSLTNLPGGVTLEVGGSLSLRSLTNLPGGVTLEVGGDLSLDSLTNLPEGVTLEVGGRVWNGAEWENANEFIKDMQSRKDA